MALDNQNNASDGQLLTYAASVLQHSSHPLALAVTAQAQQQQVALVPVTDVAEEGGAGVQARSEKMSVQAGSLDWLAQELGQACSAVARVCRFGYGFIQCLCGE